MVPPTEPPPYSYGLCCLLLDQIKHLIQQASSWWQQQHLKISTFICRHLQEKPDQKQFTIWSGVLTSNYTTCCSTSSDRPLPKWTDFGHRSLQLDRLTYAPASRTMAFTRIVLQQRLAIFCQLGRNEYIYVIHVLDSLPQCHSEQCDMA